MRSRRRRYARRTLSSFGDLARMAARMNFEDDQQAMEFLRLRGYRLTRKWDWIAPPNHTPTEAEKQAAKYLFEEWDFGGIVTDDR